MRIWAITSYFNPKRFSSRYRNFQAFRKGLKLPLLTVEWSQTGDFQLSADDSDILISVSGGDLMWQKERLLNIAIAALPTTCEVVAWLDCDILFDNDRWVEHMDSSLADAPIVQLYSKVVHLDPRGTPTPLLVRESLIAACRNQDAASLRERIRPGAFDGNVGRSDDGAIEMRERIRLGLRPSPGHAWAARRALLEKHALYDCCICGAGDIALALAALGLQDLYTDLFPLNAAQKSHYKAWADPFAASTGGSVGVIPSRIDHLFHGLLSNRQYRTRLQWASESGFDPSKDLFLDEQGLWRWTSDRLSCESWMNGYFERRSEDDDSSAGSSSA